MKTNNIFVKIAAIATSAILAFACSKPDPTPTPGPGDKTDPDVECQQVYFSPENPAQIILDGETSLVIKVGRKKTDAAISVPVSSLKVSDGISVPASVEFSEKATEADLVVSLPADLPVRTVLDLELELTGDHVDAFLSDVSNVYSAKIANPERVRAKAHITNASYVTKEQYGQWAQEIWIMSDTEFILRNFLKSDVNVTLKGSGHDDNLGLTHLAIDSATMGYGEFNETYEDNTWYFYDDNDGWKSFYPFGEDSWFSITGCSILFYDEAHIVENYYGCYIWDGGTSIYLTCTENYYSDTGDKAAYYDQIVFNWSDQDFEEVPAEQQVIDAEIVDVTGYFTSDTETTYSMEGYWDGYDFVVMDFLGSSEDLTISLDNDLNITSLSGNLVEQYNEEYGCYDMSAYNYFYMKGDYVGYMYIYSPDENTYYDYDEDAFHFNLYHDAGYYNNVAAEFDGLVLQVEE